MLWPKVTQGVGHRPRFEHAIRLVGNGYQFERCLANLPRPGVPRPVRIYREIPRHREQPGTGWPLGNRLRMQPGPEQRLLHNIFRSLPVTASQPQRIAQQRSRMLRVERAHEVFVTCPSLGLAPLDASVLCHTSVTAGPDTRFTNGARFWRESRDISGQRRHRSATGSEMDIPAGGRDMQPGRADPDRGDPQVQRQRAE